MLGIWQQKDETVLTNAVDTVNTSNILECTITRGELAILGGRRHIVAASDEIVSVLTVVGRGDRIVTSLEAELVATDEAIHHLNV